VAVPTLVLVVFAALGSRTLCPGVVFVGLRLLGEEFLALLLIVSFLAAVKIRPFLPSLSFLAHGRCGCEICQILALALTLALFLAPQPGLSLSEFGDDIFILRRVTDIESCHYKLLFWP
jgi:hypothetical protein